MYHPTLILHGGAGPITRDSLPPDLYAQYRHSLSKYLLATRQKLDNNETALDAAVFAVSLMEDDVLFNCGRGSVFNLDGEIEMEASIMVASIREEVYQDDDDDQKSSVYADRLDQGLKMGGFQKRAAAVSLVRETRHPIQLARKVLLEGDDETASIRNMHCHLSGKQVEEWGWKNGLERKGKSWFWTERRWKEHLRGLETTEVDALEGNILPSQGTVGAVCLDRWGNVAVATSTGGLTNKKPGRIGDTPSCGAGFWAESWDEDSGAAGSTPSGGLTLNAPFATMLSECFGLVFADTSVQQCANPGSSYNPQTVELAPSLTPPKSRMRSSYRRAVDMSGTGNGDSFLRTNATRSAAARCRYGGQSASSAVTAIAGPQGELEQSAGKRFGSTGEGEGGIIGIEVSSGGRSRVVSDFNCGGMWRAFYEQQDDKEVPKVMVFRNEYK